MHVCVVRLRVRVVFQKNAGAFGKEQPLVSCRKTNARLCLKQGRTLGNEVKLSAIVTELIGVGGSFPSIWSKAHKLHNSEQRCDRTQSSNL